MEWLVEGFIPFCQTGQVGALWGQPIAFKSFLAIDLACSVATGRSWMDKPTQPGGVVYIAVEGLADLRDRLAAWEAAAGQEVPDTAWFWQGGFDLLRSDKLEEIEECIDARMPVSPALIVVDTLSRAMAGGDENGSADMGKAVESMARLARRYGSTVIAVHHSDKTGHHIRGHSCLRAALDFEYRMTRRGQSASAILSCEKPKGFAPPADLALTTRVVEIEDGRSTLVIDCATIQAGQTVSVPTVTVPQDRFPYLKLLAKLAEWRGGEPWQSTEGLTTAGTTKGRWDKAVPAWVCEGAVEKLDRGLYRITAAGLASVLH